MFRLHDARRVPALAVGVLLLTACGDGGDAEPAAGTLTQRAVGDRSFGIHCTEDYEGGWAAYLPEGFTICDRFSTTLDDQATREFYFNLIDKEDYWEAALDGADNSLEDVDLFFGFTHGAVSTVDALWAMYDENHWVNSSAMSLGNELRGTSVFATYSGYTMQVDSYTWNRWDSVFSGGLRMALGSHGTLYSTSADRDAAKVFAQYLNAGYSFKTAWAAGFDLTGTNNQDVAVMATGTNATDCATRRDNLSWDNFSFAAYPRLTTSIGAWCGWTWSNI